jgi:hypothetical protein
VRRASDDTVRLTGAGGRSTCGVCDALLDAAVGGFTTIVFVVGAAEASVVAETDGETNCDDGRLDAETLKPFT